MFIKKHEKKIKNQIYFMFIFNKKFELKIFFIYKNLLK
jgi:hypothetical protein